MSVYFLLVAAGFFFLVGRFLDKRYEMECKPARPGKKIGTVSLNIHFVMNYEGHPVRFVVTPYNAQMINGESQTFLLTNN